MIDLEFGRLSRGQRYKLMTGLIVPRPIAFVTTLSADGVVNAAPYSFFNAISDEPPLVMLSIDMRADGTDKDTGRNILASGEFVINLVDEPLAQAMHASSAPVPPEVSEPQLTGLALAPSSVVAPPRAAAAPIAFECRLWNAFPIPGRRLVIGEIVALHAQPGLVDPATLRVDLDAHQPIGRLAGAAYLRTGDRFVLDQNAYTQALAAAGLDANEGRSRS